MTDHDPARRVGLGRVVEDHLSTGSPDPDDPGGPDAPDGMRDEHDVVEAAKQSFPASDPPTFMSEPATPRDREGQDPVATPANRPADRRP
jgi:hypothetical protein